MELSEPIRGRSFQRRVSVGGPLWTFGGFLRGLGGASAAMVALECCGVGVLQVFVMSYARDGLYLQAQLALLRLSSSRRCFLVSYVPLGMCARCPGSCYIASITHYLTAKTSATRSATSAQDS